LTNAGWAVLQHKTNLEILDYGNIAISKRTSKRREWKYLETFYLRINEVLNENQPDIVVMEDYKGWRAYRPSVVQERFMGVFLLALNIHAIRIVAQFKPVEYRQIVYQRPLIGPKQQADVLEKFFGQRFSKEITQALSVALAFYHIDVSQYVEVPRHNGRIKFGDVKGEDHQNAKFKESDILEIRRLSAEGWTIRSLAEKYNVTYMAIYYIIKRQRWMHI
jgi:Holliday junction resolvasome RuvABC endonuclease subunit